MASDIDGTMATARRFTAVVQHFLHFILTSRGIGFCNIECQMLNVGRNLTQVHALQHSRTAQPQNQLYQWQLDTFMLRSDSTWWQLSHTRENLYPSPGPQSPSQH